MANADITNKDITVPGVNSATNFIKSTAFELDFAVVSDIVAVGTHDLIDIPAGETLVGLKVIVVGAVTSGGAGTVQFKVGGNTINSTALALAGLAKGFVHNLVVTGVNAYSDGTVPIQLTVGTAALTGGKLLCIAETIPGDMFITAG